MTGSEDKGSQSPRDDFPGNLERLLRSDLLLAPYFEKKVLHVVGEPGEDLLWIDPALEEEAREFVRGRVMAILLGVGDEVLERAARKWEKREEMIKVLMADEVLRHYFEDGSLSISNRPDTGLIAIKAEREKARAIADRLIKVKREKFGDTPEDDSQA